MRNILLITAMVGLSITASASSFQYKHQLPNYWQNSIVDFSLNDTDVVELNSYFGYSYTKAQWLSQTSIMAFGLSDSAQNQLPVGITKLQNLTSLRIVCSAGQTKTAKLGATVKHLKKLETIQISWCADASIHSNANELTNLQSITVTEVPTFTQLPSFSGSKNSIHTLITTGTSARWHDTHGDFTSLKDIGFTYSMNPQLPSSVCSNYQSGQYERIFDATVGNWIDLSGGYWVLDDRCD